VTRIVKRTILLAAAVAALGLLVWALLPAPVAVDTATVERGPLQVTVDEEAKTRIRQHYVVAAPVDGQLQRIMLEPGDSVQAGRTVVAVIESSDPPLLDARARAEAQARARGAEARLAQTAPAAEQARVELQLAESEYDRLRSLPTGNVSTKEVEDARRTVAARTEALHVAQIAQEIARYEVQVAHVALQRTFAPATQPADRQIELTSPVDGQVLRIIQKSTSPVVPGTAILEVGDRRDLEVVMEVLSTEAVKVRPGQRVEFVRWGGDQPIHGVVRLIEPQAFTKVSALGVEEQRVRIISDLSDPPQQYQPLGDAFRLDGRIIVWDDPDALIVPTSALFRQGLQWQVFVVMDGRAQARDVAIGQMNGLAAQVLDGLSDGERVIVHPSDQVSDDRRVRSR
jgi:HlyD family secretion protein